MQIHPYGAMVFMASEYKRLALFCVKLEDDRLYILVWVGKQQFLFL